ncbi:MAG: MarR family transcriptional regulator [Clostridia bacterium]|nr:MarR family transcriptional regulator [Clostridia bacterium]
MDRFSTFTVLVNRIVRNIHKIKVEEMSRFGLKGTHVSCLYYLYREGKPITASELTVICDEDKAAISRAVDYLSREGYVVCEGTALKKYKSPVVLTQKGIEVSKSVANRVDSILAAASEGLSDEDRAVFYKGLDLISGNLQKICDGKEECGVG